MSEVMDGRPVADVGSCGKTASHAPVVMLVTLLLLLATLLLSAPARALPAEAAAELLRAADPSLALPASARLVLRAGPEGGDRTVPLEVWRRDEDVLVRFLDERNVGKFLLLVDGRLHLDTPGTRQPVALHPGHRLAGIVTIDEMLGLRYADDYEIDSAEELAPGGLVELVLHARSETAPYPRVSLVVDPESRRPVRSELFVGSGKLVRLIEFLEWTDTGTPQAILVKDLLRHSAVRVDFLEIEAREVPIELFDLEEGSARAELGG